MKFAVLGSINMDLLLKMHHVPAAGESHIIDSYSYLLHIISIPAFL